MISIIELYYYISVVVVCLFSEVEKRVLFFRRDLLHLHQVRVQSAAAVCTSALVCLRETSVFFITLEPHLKHEPLQE